MLKKTFVSLLFLSLALCADYGRPRVHHDGNSFGGGTNAGRTIRKAFNLAFAAMAQRVSQPHYPGEIIQREGRADGVLVKCLFTMPSAAWQDTIPGLPVTGQLGNAQYNLMQPSGSVFENGLAFLTDTAGCITSVISYEAEFYHENAGKRELPEESTNTTIPTGIHYFPQNSTTHAKLPSLIPPRNGPGCKRSDAGDMLWCMSHDTIVPGYGLTSGGRIYSGVGHYTELQGDGNLCSTDRNGKKYWCLWSHRLEGSGPYRAVMYRDGILNFYDNKNQIRAVSTTILIGKQPDDGYYRLTLQNDGNLVLYRGVNNNEPIWASHPGAPPFPSYAVDRPCLGKFIS
ncbi:hypothetical protein MVEG_12434 [Podila verticillata NRRL 6337]|uniref:Bulb-type lectin domain-containing protein n=1 Tax=Podila verticillata NRRL 6337 TaxID=1069443 RepID=A0A086TIE9_9FUNG|nr:hypothetical protein MVEG_12434 [Podila verticillata NRRL 6337]